MEKSPFITITKDNKNKTWSISSNFLHVLEINENFCEKTNSLFELSDEYSKYCMGMIDSGYTLSFVGKAILSKSINEEMKPFLKEKSISFEEKKVDSTKDIITYSFDENDLMSIRYEVYNTLSLLKVSESLAESNLSAIIAEFEFFLVRFSQIHAKNDPKKFINGSETLTLGSLLESSIEKIISEKVDKKIRDEMRGSLFNIIKWISNICDINFEKIKSNDDFKCLMEACQRRNILIHNGGIVNEEYLKNCSELGIKKDTLPKIGDKISVSPQYMKKISCKAYLVGLFIMHISIQKIGPKEALKSLQVLLEISHKFLMKKQTKISRSIINFSENSRIKIPNDLQLCFAINKALSYLREEGLDEDYKEKKVKDVLENYDWSMITPLFSLALACVKRDFDNIIPLAKKAFEDGVSYTVISTFIVFEEARKIPGFIECFPKENRKINVSSNKKIA